jgi:beta-lactam-binding protein with PASTA domain/tRNA A-37 threonylcarbamoyl transferase component Bud32
MTQPRLLGGRYELDGVVGRGGMAEVYRARDLRLDRIVAVKTLREDLARDQTFQARFRREAQSAASLNHPSIVAVYDTGEDNTSTSHVPFIVMEYVDGRTIRDLLRDDRRLMPERALEITDGVLRALDYSHRNGIVHRDIKPGNVMLNRQGEIKVMDFGIARAVADTQATMTQTAQVIGTAQYLSPEQARGERVDARSDLYSVGCLLYELLTGRPPFTGDSPVAIAYQHVRENPVPPTRVDPDLPGWADPIVLRAMEKDPADRYQSAAEMRGDIQRALSGFPIGARMRPAGAYAADPGTRRLDPMSQTQMQGRTGALPPYEYGPPDGRQTESRQFDGPRRRRAIWPWVTAAVALIVIGSAFFAYQTISGQGTGVAVPANLVGLKLQNADNEIVHAGLTFRNISEAPPSNGSAYKVGTVASTNPSPGTQVAKSSQVTVYYYRSPGSKQIPKVAGLSTTAAELVLKQHGFTNYTVGNSVLSSTIKPGFVVRTDPPYGTSVNPTTLITLITAAAGVEVPNVVGEPLAIAENTLLAHHLFYSVMKQADPSGATSAGYVWQIMPNYQTLVASGSTVTLYVQPGSPSPSPSPTTTSPSPSPSPTSSTP